jgi:adenosylcobinamide-phosphate synthase
LIGRKILVTAFLLDWIAGDPEWFPHPVRLVGKFIDCGERGLRKPNQGPLVEFVVGGALAFGMVAACYVVTTKTIDYAYKKSYWFGVTAETILAWTCLASRSLHDEAAAVIAALDTGNLSLARERLARIVGRDIQHLDAMEISRAVIETVSESASDGVIAPLFYMAVGGVPLAMAYKTINTLDSMIGHSNEKYFYFGKSAARLDDVANYLPARITALSIAVTAATIEDASCASSLITWFQDGSKHRSPNAGQPESAMAGALQVRLGGTNFYDGEAMSSSLIGGNFSQPSVQQAKRALQIVAVVSVLGVIAAALLRSERK